MSKSLQTRSSMQCSIRETGESYIVCRQQEEFVSRRKVKVLISWPTVIVMVALCVAIGFCRPWMMEEMEVKEPTVETMEVSVEEIEWQKSGILIPESSERSLDEGDIRKLEQVDGYTKAELIRFAINEIYARHHYLFVNEKYLNFYSGYEWYDGYLDAEAAVATFSKTEHQNIALLLKEEEQCKSK